MLLKGRKLFHTACDAAPQRHYDMGWIAWPALRPKSAGRAVQQHHAFQINSTHMPGVMLWPSNIALPGTSILKQFKACHAVHLHFMAG